MTALVAALALALAAPRCLHADESVAIAAILSNLSKNQCTRGIDTDDVTYGTDLLMGAYTWTRSTNTGQFYPTDVPVNIGRVAVNSSNGAVMVQVDFPGGPAPSGTYVPREDRYVVMAAITPFFVMWTDSLPYPPLEPGPYVLVLSPNSMVHSPVGTLPMVRSITDVKTIIFKAYSGWALTGGTEITLASPVAGASPYIVVAPRTTNPFTNISLHCVNIGFVYAYVNSQDGYFEGFIDLTCANPQVVLGRNSQNNGVSSCL